MNDLLGLVKTGTSNGRTPSRHTGDVEAPVPAPGTVGDAEMDKFFQQVAVMKGLMADIRNLHNQLEDANERSKTVTRSEEMHAIRESMQDDANAISRAADAIKRHLQELERSNEASLKRKGCGKGSASERTRTAVTAALKKKLKDQMGEFQDLRARVQREYREVVERRVFTVTGQHATEDEVDRLIEAGEGESVFQKAILEQGRGYVLDTLAEIRERRDAVVELERSLMELHQVFLDMAVLVEAQGQMIDNIEAQVARSAEYVQSGINHLSAVKATQRKTRKWMCCGIVLGIIVIIAVVIASIGLIKGF